LNPDRGKTTKSKEGQLKKKVQKKLAWAETKKTENGNCGK